MRIFSKESDTYTMINSTQKVVFHVFLRDSVGSKSARKLRSQGKAIGNIYGLSLDSMSVFMDKHGVKKLYEEMGDTSLVYLQVGDQKKQIPVLIDDYETDPVLQSPIHISFKRVNLSDPIQADVSVSLSGEAKLSNAVISLIKDSVTVEALPADLPDNFDIDISDLSEVGQTITLADLTISSDVKLILGEDETPEEVVLVSVQEIKEEVEEEQEEIETEITGKSGSSSEEDTEEIAPKAEKTEDSTEKKSE